ncbi:MAG TPA: protein translocase subunit SecF [Candidatus Baltobacteraceae bacterium]|nr:protein translocase subunit SecF [Verrucomicrobiae bacterium]HTX14064.1 protein translocase subunit SecF [Candidatus Baltobacteraceae bacterium]
MEIFRDVNIDWMGKAKYFVTLSLILLAIGWTSILRHHGLDYGIDFRGGTLVYIRFANEPQMDKIRKGLQAAGLSNSTIQSISDISNPNSRNDVVIGLEEKGQGNQALDAGKEAILAVLHKLFGTPAGKPDFNSISAADLAAYLTQKDPLNLGATSGERYDQLARRLLAARDSDRGGIVTNFSELSNVDGVTPNVISSLSSGLSLGDFTIRNVEIVGPKVGAQLRHQAFFATLYALGGMLIYIAFRFEWVYGAAAVIAVFHDVLITLGFFSLFHYEISLTVIAALLTLVGYSMNDTIVIFDRVREDLRLMRREEFPVVVNKAINQTLSRTILTSGLTFLTVLVLFLMGGEVLRAFSFAMVVGVVVGTYSSFGIAAPIVVLWNRHRGQGAAIRVGSAADKRVPAAARR